MAEPLLHDWADVNSYMRDDYRLLVAGMAARALKEADPELLTLARAAFGGVPVAGARSFFRADLIGQRKALAKAMQNQMPVAPLVIALWSHTAEKNINVLKMAGAQAGLLFAEDWNWRRGMEGFYDFQDIPLLTALADGLGEHMSEQDYDHLKLAALWLGPAVTNREALAVPAADESETETTESEL